jgi:thioredoxin reductase (NADPH)
MNNQIKLYGAEWCPDCRRTKDFLIKNNFPYEYINVDVSPEASNLVENINNGKRIIPTLIIDNVSMINPSNYELSKKLGINEQGTIKLFGADWCPDCRRAKRFLQDNQLNFQFIDVDDKEESAEYVMSINNGKRIIPTLLIDDKPFTNPSNQTLTEVLKLDTPSDERIYDTVIIGAGAAGLTTAIYAQRDKFDTIILERKNIGGNAFITKKIENYPGFKEVSGPELMEKMAEQATILGTKIETGIEVKNIEKKQDHFIIYSENQLFKGKSIVVATGSTYKTLGVKGEAELIGSGVHFCATCDGAFYRDKEVIVIGGGNSALEESMFLAEFCKKVTIIHRSETFSATETYIEKLETFKNIEVILNHSIETFEADEKGLFEQIFIKNNSTKKQSQIEADGVFIFIGLIPNTNPYKSLLNLSDSGHILTKGLNKTNVEGIFAAGDCRKGAIAQVASATGEGVVASYGLKEYLKR